MRIYHIALAEEWAKARQSGTYHTSTYGRTLADEGFIHASRREQVPTAYANHYRGVRERLVLLTIDTNRLDAEWREDPVGQDTFPHIYGPLNVSAVVTAEPLNRQGGTDPFLVIFFREAMTRILVAVAAMALAGVGAALGRRSEAEWAPFLGAMAGLLLVAVTVVGVRYRRSSADSAVTRR
ncbi:MAG: DUF952 domain-containing protein [Nocardioides sp.]